MNNNDLSKNKRSRFKIIVTGIVVVLVLLFSFTGISKPVISIFNDVAGFFGRIVGAPSNVIGRGTDSVGQLFSTFSENRKLRSRISDLTSDHVRLQAIQEENQSLKETLGLRDTLTDYQLVTAQTISRSPTTFNTQITINQGSNAGIKLNQMVLAGNGVIGRVTQVNQTNSKVSLISDDSSSSDYFSVEIRTQSGEVISGIISGYNKGDGTLIMNQLSSDADIDEGDIIMTSGRGGVVPSGLYVGNVSSISDDNYGMSKQIFIKPSGNLNNISTVLVAIEVGGEMDPNADFTDDSEEQQ